MGSQDESTPLLSRKGAERRPERKTRMREVFNIIVCIACLYYFMFGIEKIGKFTMDLIRGRLAPRPGVGDGPRGQQAVDGKWHWTWESVTPSTELSWTPCYPWASADFYCSRLTVPMDYHRPLDDEHPEHPQVQLALVLLPGKNSTFLNGGRFNPSPILFNPGGPGGSGTLLVVGLGEALQKVVGEHHDLIGFDPRGIGSSQPKADCFLHGHPKEAPVTVADENAAMMRRFAYELTRLDVGLVNSSSVALGKIDAHHRGKAQLCAERDEELGDNSIFRYMGTPNVARDMLSIVHAWDRWTERMDMTGREHMMETRGKLVYWGFSYGTMLGATYAAMFPDKVGRVILDGVVDADLYVGETWRESLRDTDYIEDKLFDYCAEAGTMCRLYRKGDTPADIRARFEGVMARLRAEPLHIVHPYAHMPLLVSYSDVKALLFTSLYSPNTMFPTIALLVDLLARQLDISPLLTPLDLGSMCVTKDMTWPIYPDDGLAGVMCGDKRYKLNETLPELEKRFLGFANFSRFADVVCSQVPHVTSFVVRT